ncbi:MAG: hypothetical protein ACJ0Q6_02885 [Candidatus Azotimanducaceae bacterium]
MPDQFDIIVIGTGNVVPCAVLSAQESGAPVLIMERALESQKGVNSRYTAGAMRATYDGTNYLRTLMPELSDEEINQADFDTYTRDQFFDDMGLVTQYRSDPDLTEILIDNSLPTLQWMNSKRCSFPSDVRPSGI